LYLFARNLVFVGRRAGRFQARKINELRARLKQGYWAMGDACGQFVLFLPPASDFGEVLLLVGFGINETLAAVRRHFF